MRHTEIKKNLVSGRSASPVSAVSIPAHSLLKWPGSKEQELQDILPLIPPHDTYYEPFLGGGSVGLSLRGRKILNDASSELVAFYQMVASQNAEFFSYLDHLDAWWMELSLLVEQQSVHLLDLYNASRVAAEKTSWQSLCRKGIAEIAPVVEMWARSLFPPFSTAIPPLMETWIQRKMMRMRELERIHGAFSERDILASLEAAYKSAWYGILRDLLNHAREYSEALTTTLFFYVREYAYASMFRFNKAGYYNAPYGGASYSHKSLARKIAYLRSSQVAEALDQTIVENRDFEEYLRAYKPGPKDFIFGDPPYPSAFCSYGTTRFGHEDQLRLAHYLIYECEARFLLVVKKTPSMLDLYNAHGLSIRSIEKTYAVNFQTRNDRAVEHLIITNYTL